MTEENIFHNHKKILKNSRRSVWLHLCRQTDISEDDWQPPDVRSHLFQRRRRRQQRRTNCDSLRSLSTVHTLEDRKGLKQTFLNDSGKHFFADIVYSQNFVFEEKKKKIWLIWLVWIFSLPSSSPLWYFYIQGASHVFGVKEFWRVLLDLYCLVKCSYNHSPMWSTLSLLSFLYFLLLKARFFGASCTL